MSFDEVTIGSARLIRGDCRKALSELPAESVHCCVTSPPYFGLRDYGVVEQIGLEATPAAYIVKLVEIMRGVRRVLRNDGTLWLNIGDSYAGSAIIGPARSGEYVGNGGKATLNVRNRNGLGAIPGIKPKDLIGIPWMLAFALRDDGWYLRRDIIWHKPNPMPESVTDRPTSAHEYLFLLTKSARYYYDGEAIKEPAISTRPAGNKNGFIGSQGGSERVGPQLGGPGSSQPWHDIGGSRNKRSVWTIATTHFRGAHFATFPPALVEPCILAGTSERGVCQKCGAPGERVRIETKSWREDAETAVQSYMVGSGYRTARSVNGGMSTSEYETIGWRPTCSCDAGAVPATVLDPFAGASTTALVAERLGRRSVSIELSAAYHDIACQRIEAAQTKAAA